MSLSLVPCDKTPYT